MSEEKNIEESQQDGKSESPEDRKLKNQQEELNENILPTGQAGSQEQAIEPTKIEQSEIPLTSGTINQTSENRTSEIKNMEVHHHPKVEKKNFKESVVYYFNPNTSFILST